MDECKTKAKGTKTEDRVFLINERDRIGQELDNRKEVGGPKYRLIGIKVWTLLMGISALYS